MQKTTSVRAIISSHVLNQMFTVMATFTSLDFLIYILGSPSDFIKKSSSIANGHLSAQS